jgi:tetratricopeptide (TPR) repeat protein
MNRATALSLPTLEETIMLLAERSENRQSQARRPVTESLDAPALNRRAIERFQQGDREGALDSLREAVMAGPEYAEAWNNSGLVRQTLGQLAQARADFDQALAIRPEYPEALVNRARCLLALGDPGSARADLDEALRHVVCPFAAVVLHNRAALRQSQGDLVGALEDWDGAVAADSEFVAAFFNRGMARKESGNLEGALADFDRALELASPETTPAILHARGGVRVLRNDFAGAVEDYNLALVQQPDNVILYFSRGHARYHRRDLRGVSDYRMAFRLDPEAAAQELVRYLKEDVRRDPAGVLENCEKHLRISGRDLIAHVRRGFALVLLGRETEAAPDLDAFLRMAPDFESHLRRVLSLLRPAGGREPAVPPLARTCSTLDAAFAEMAL